MQYRIWGCRRTGPERSWSEKNFGPKMRRRIAEENDKSTKEKGGRFDTEEEKGGKQILWMVSTGGFESHFAIGGSYLSIGSKTKSCLT